MKFKKFNSLENMMTNILSESSMTVWGEIEKEKNAIKRCQLRNLFSQALKKIAMER